MKRSKIVIGTVGAVLLLLISIFAWQRFTDSNRLRPVSDEELGEAIYLAAQYLEKQIEADGRFVYRVNANSKIEVPDKYNVLRHAGAIYSLAMYLKAYPNEDFKAKTLQATKYLIDNSLGPVRAAPELPPCGPLLKSFAIPSFVPNRNWVELAWAWWLWSVVTISTPVLSLRKS